MKFLDNQKIVNILINISFICSVLALIIALLAFRESEHIILAIKSSAIFASISFGICVFALDMKNSLKKLPSISMSLNILTIFILIVLIFIYYISMGI